MRLSRCRTSRAGTRILNQAALRGATSLPINWLRSPKISANTATRTVRGSQNTALEALREQAARRPPNEPDLLEDLPRLALQLTNAPDALQRDLYEAFGLEIVYDHNTKRATIHATLTTETLPAAAQATAALTAIAPPKPAAEPPPASNQTSTRPVAGRATTEKSCP